MEQTGIDQVIIPCSKSNSKRVPSLQSGTLFFSLILIFPLCMPCHAKDITTLAVDLFAEADFEACKTECFRILASDPTNETSLLLKAVSEVRLKGSNTSNLKHLADSSAISSETRAMAQYELARSYWKNGKAKEALLEFKKTFISTSRHNLFLRAGCSISLLLEEYPSLTSEVSDIEPQIDASSQLWSNEILNECRWSRNVKEDSLTGKPAQWMITFYRKQISPALGRRCSLVPSCSEYAMQSLKKHGALGVAMIGDRTIREPDVVAEKGSPVRIGNKQFYKDSVKEHDWWMESKKNSQEK